ncbi:alpha/beta hydrolase family protein [Fodinicurvata fenggangensis]|uniref:alpha/beta hydrolase family protein n=1 Tax=Fodinicurvata fenggangensis TaxID=1121830 RepID=UPI000478F6F1|nr:alpha/beta fold hydrolase [Fodinicurvata fenggangensis]
MNYFTPFATRNFNAQLQRSLGKAYLGAASIGEVMATAADIRDANVDSWHQAWRRLAERLETRAEHAQAAGQQETARGLFLRAAEAWRQSCFYHRINLDCRELQEAWPRIAACFQGFMNLSPWSGEGMQIPYEGGTLHAYLALPASNGRPYRTLVLPSGYDSSLEEMLVMVGLPALARGYAVLAVDGPGQGKTLYDPEIRAFMRPDFETALKAVVDRALEDSRLDPECLVAMGVSFGGYLVPRAAGGEPRLAALVADPGQYDIGSAMFARLPPNMIERLDEDSQDAHDIFESLAQGNDGTFLFRPRMAAHGVDSVQDYCRQLVAYHNRDAAPHITCPSLICDNEEDAVSTGQGQLLANAMTAAEVTFQRFTKAEGAGGHCEGMGREIFDERVFAWLDDVFTEGRPDSSRPSRDRT